MEACSSYFLPRLVGHSNASYLVSTGAVFPPTAKHFGSLFNEIMSEASQVLPRALELATEIAENVSPTASYLNRAMMWRNVDSPEGAHLVESKSIYHMFASAYVYVICCNCRFKSDDFIETRRKVSPRSLRSGNLTSGPIWMMMCLHMCLGGRRLILAGLPRPTLRRSCNRLVRPSDYHRAKCYIGNKVNGP